MVFFYQKIPEIKVNSSVDPNSPIGKVFFGIPAALINIAPEQIEIFTKIHSDFTLNFIEDSKWTLNVDTEKKLIKISSASLELLWVQCLLHFRFYSVYQRTDISKQTPIALQESDKIIESQELMDWILNKIWNNGPEGWPEGLASPLTETTFDCDEATATELAIGAAAVLIHHELAHIALGHSGSSEIDCERDADAFAWDWILEKEDSISVGQGVKRILIMIEAYLLQLAHDIRNENNVLIGHPRGVDRLVNLLERFEFNANDIAYAYPFAIIQLHLGVTSNPTEIRGVTCRTFRDGLEMLIEHIAAFDTVERPQRDNTHKKRRARCRQ